MEQIVRVPVPPIVKEIIDVNKDVLQRIVEQTGGIICGDGQHDFPAAHLGVREHFVDVSVPRVVVLHL